MHAVADATFLRHRFFMDESVELFKTAQERMAQADRFNLARQLATGLLTLMVINGTMWGFLLFLGSFPRNPDNSMKLAIYGPPVAAIAVIAAVILKLGRPRMQVIRWTCWFYIAFALICLPTGLIDLIARNGN